MGCDIHMVMERRKQNEAEWVGAWSSDAMPGGRPGFARRDYGLFQRFGVRGYRDDCKIVYPRNIPEDVSRLAWSEYMRCPTDYHSASHCTPTEFAEAWLAENPDDNGVRAEFALYDMFGIESGEERYEYRLVFWFDN